METYKKSEKQKVEFILYINGNIICQRPFNVYEYNEKALKSMDLYHMVTECTDIIENSLRVKTREYLWSCYNPYKVQEQQDISKRTIDEIQDNYKLEIRVGDRSVVTRGFSATPYHYDVRYQVDIRAVVPDIRETIRYYLTKDEYNCSL